ncbi:MAG: META domain-containing protein [Methanoregulaceae archaeon]|nr:META domain-containing protein [Methanoregulaceae archaeon]
MKILVLVFLICVTGGLLVSGCTAPVAQPTPVPTTVATPLPTVTAPVRVTDTQLIGTWTLGEMGSQGGQAVLTIFPTPITLTFTNLGTVSGSGGCNNYNGGYTLSGESGPFGKQISIGPLASTQMYCAGSSNLESTYLQILQAANSYSIDNNAILSLRAPSGSTLVFQRT